MFSQIVLSPVGKIVVLTVTIFLFIVGIIGSTKVVQNFDDDWFIPDSSWFKKVLNIRNEYFSEFSGKGAIPFSAYTKNNEESPFLDYFRYQDELSAISQNLKV